MHIAVRRDAHRKDNFDGSPDIDDGKNVRYCAGCTGAAAERQLRTPKSSAQSAP